MNLTVYLLIAMTAIAISLLVVGFNGLRAYKQARKWIKVPGLITSLSEDYKEIRYSVYWRLKYFFPVVKYVYELDGRKYQSDRASLHLQDIWVPEVDRWGNKTGEEQKVWRGWKVSEPVDVYVDPRDPQRAVLVPTASKVQRSHYLALISAGLLCLAVALLIQLYWMN